MPKSTNNPEMKRFEQMQKYLKRVNDIVSEMPYQKDQEAVLINTRRALAATQNRISVLKIDEGN